MTCLSDVLSRHSVQDGKSNIHRGEEIMSERASAMYLLPFKSKPFICHIWGLSLWCPEHPPLTSVRAQGAQHTTKSVP